MGNEERGATLTQLLVTMNAVIGTLVLIGAHQVNQWLPHYRLHAAARALVVQIQRARLQAIQRGAPNYLDFDVDGDGCLRSGGCLLWEDWNGNLHKDPLERGETVLDFLALPGVWLKPYPQEQGGPSRGPHDTELARALDPRRAASLIVDFRPYEVTESAAAALAVARRRAGRDGAIVVTGSNFLVAELYRDCGGAEDPLDDGRKQ